LDTRAKIISAQQARLLQHSQPTRWYAGHFDPLLAEHARILRDFARSSQRLIVEITNPPAPLLSQRARAELVAGLACVDHVTLSEAAAPNDEINVRFVQRIRQRANGATP
jgi:phosphopantetheine adenylyltransferase